MQLSSRILPRAGGAGFSVSNHPEVRGDVRIIGSLRQALLPFPSCRLPIATSVPREAEIDPRGEEVGVDRQDLLQLADGGVGIAQLDERGRQSVADVGEARSQVDRPAGMGEVPDAASR